MRLARDIVASLALIWALLIVVLAVPAVDAPRRPVAPTRPLRSALVLPETWRPHGARCVSRSTIAIKPGVPAPYWFCLD